MEWSQWKSWGNLDDLAHRVVRPSFQNILEVAWLHYFTLCVCYILFLPILIHCFVGFQRLRFSQSLLYLLLQDGWTGFELTTAAGLCRPDAQSWAPVDGMYGFPPPYISSTIMILLSELPGRGLNKFKYQLVPRPSHMEGSSTLTHHIFFM